MDIFLCSMASNGGVNVHGPRLYVLSSLLSVVLFKNIKIFDTNQLVLPSCPATPRIVTRVSFQYFSHLRDVFH